MAATDQIERRHRALMQLTEWRRWKEKRDELVRQAAAAGISKADIAVIVGVRRATVYNILARQDGGVRSGE